MKDQRAKSREVLFACKLYLLVNNAKGNRPQAARESTDLKMKKTGQFGEHEPEALRRTVWLVLSLHFGFTTRDESRRLHWGDIGVENVTVLSLESRSLCG